MLSSIRKFYIEGYGVPKKYYSDEDLEALRDKGIITQRELDELADEKSKQDNS